MYCAVPQCHLMALQVSFTDAGPFSLWIPLLCPASPLLLTYGRLVPGHGCGPQGLGIEPTSIRSRPCRVLTGARGALQGSVSSLHNVFVGSVGAGLSQRGWKRGSSG